jgi:hypothetical protein
MALSMVSLNIKKSGAIVARKAIPKDARAEYKRLYGVRPIETLMASHRCVSLAYTSARHKAEARDRSCLRANQTHLSRA